jgi:membrane-associated protease RseP (regulator of RpoE activity)
MSAEPGSQGRGAIAPAVEPAPPSSEPPPSADGQGAPLRWKVNALLFAATVVSTFLAGAMHEAPDLLKSPAPVIMKAILGGWPFAVPLLAILLTHEFGHYIAARVHRVDASLPYFIPLPVISYFGTMGAIISMRGRIRSRDALLDIGASGPLAGLCVAVPVLVVGLMHSQVLVSDGLGLQEGQCLLYLGLKRVVLGPIPAGYDVFLTPMAFAGWVGLFITMLNLVAVAQLDGGHIAYALFGARQNRYARVLHNLLLVIFAVNVARSVGPLVLRREWADVPQAFGNSCFWLAWYVIILVIMRFGGRDHPPTEPGELHPVRKGLAVLSLVLFALLFMPTPLASY